MLFAIDHDDLARLGEAGSDAELGAIVAALEESWDARSAFELDEAWDATLGGARLHDGDEPIVTVTAPDEVQRITRALERWDRACFEQAYDRIPRGDYGDLDEADPGYVWACFDVMRPFWRGPPARAARAVVFGVEP